MIFRQSESLGTLRDFVEVSRVIVDYTSFPFQLLSPRVAMRQWPYLTTWIGSVIEHSNAL